MVYVILIETDISIMCQELEVGLRMTVVEHEEEKVRSKSSLTTYRNGRMKKFLRDTSRKM